MALNDKPNASGQFVSSVWTFPTQDHERRSPYRWYGTLPTGLVDQLMDLYAPLGSSVLDPFTGSGTVPVTAARRGLQFEGRDVNPLAVLLARTRLNTADYDALQDAWADVRQCLGKPSFERESATLLSRELAAGHLAYSARWMSAETLERLWITARAIAQIGNTECESALYVALAGAVRTVANVDARCTHHLVTKVKPYVDCVRVVERTLTERRPVLQLGTSAAERIRQADFSSTDSFDEHDLVVAHPPYLGVIHYNQIHRLATDLLGLLATVDRPGALTGLNWMHEDIKSQDMSTDNASRYESFIQGVSDSLVKSTKVGGRAVLIIGDQRHKGMLRHPFTSYIREMESRAFALEENFIWVLQNNGGMHVLRRGHFIDHNYVLVFRRLP